MATRGPNDLVSEEQTFAADVERLDRESPGWDKAAKLARARSFLKTLVSRDEVVQIYGEDLVAEAEALNANEGK